MNKKIKRVLASGLSLAMVCVLGTSIALQAPVSNKHNGTFDAPIAAMGDSGLEKLSDKFVSQLSSEQFINPEYVSKYDPKTLNVKTNGSRRIIVEFASDSQLDTYLNEKEIQAKFTDFTDYVNSDLGTVYADKLELEHSSFIKALKKTQISYTLRHKYTSILNAVALEVDDSDVEYISKMSGVKNVIYSEVYSVPTVEPTVNVVDVYDTGIYNSKDLAYKGDGMLVAVLDTGFDIAHNAFRTMPEVEKITLADVENVFDKLEAKTYGEEVTAEDLYYNKKVPFAYDYADGDSDVFAISNSHGVHVAGIIAGQDDSVTAEDGKAFEKGEKFVGVAPNAQLFIGKVFPDTDNGEDNGAETDDILAAIADCVTVGTDVINMSLGSSCGFSREEDGNAINTVYDKVYAAGINLVVAASNSYSSALNGAYGSTNLTSNPDSSTVGSPSTYTAALSVASVSGQKSPYMLLDDGTAIYFNEASNSAGQKGDFVDELLKGEAQKTFNYVVVPGYGKPGNYTAAVQTELVKGNCIAVVSRGDISFEDKQKNAFDNGAIACIIYNNVSGMISATLGTGKKIPTCTVDASIGQRFVKNGKGTITLDKNNEAGPFMSEFSSWGPTNDLKIKPEITAHGGDITSAVVGGYDQLSGTSMASPNMAGAVTLLRQHVSEHYNLSGIALANRVNQLLMSTATIIYDEYGLPYSVRKQGAGNGDIGKSIKTKAFLYVENCSKPKLELGDDPERSGIYTMEFHVQNISDVTKTYNMDVIAMTESVSIDGITVEEKAYLLNSAQKTYYVNGKKSGSTVTVGAGADVTVSVTLTLSATEREYLNANFKNGMYVEGYVTLEDADTQEGVDLSIPYLAFYGDWADAPIFDVTKYEVSADKYNSSIKEEDKRIACGYETVVIGKYAREYEYYLPLGQYVYTTDADDDGGVEASVDKIAIGNSDYGIYELYAVYFGLLRAAGEMQITIENAVTGEVLRSETQYNIRKSHGGTPSFTELEMSPYELGLQNNEKYTMRFVASIDYDNGETRTEECEFTFYVDYQAPMIYDSVVRYEENGDDRKAYLDLKFYDNHYMQSVQIFYMPTEDESDYLSENAIPITENIRDGVTSLSIDITDWMDNFASAQGQYKNRIGIRLDDYAMNATAYLVSVNTTTVDEVKVNFEYKDAEGQQVIESLAGKRVELKPGEELDLSDGKGTVYSSATGSVSATFSVDMVGYTTYVCSNPDAHGVACGFKYDERKGLTYKKGQYYRDSETGEIKQKDADDTVATYKANTRYVSVIAGEVVKNGNRYVQPDDKKFVCPDCGAEETWKFDRRTGKITPSLLMRSEQDPMIEDVQWTSNRTNVVKVEAGKLFAVGTGTATITAKTGSSSFTFTVKVDGDSVNTYIERLTVGSYYNHTLNQSRSVSNGYALVECGSVLDLYPKINPWYVTDIPDLTWQTSNPDVVEILSGTAKTAKVVCKKPGAVNILLSSASYGLIGSFTLAVDEEYTLSSYYFYQYHGTGYSETYTENNEERKMLVIPANLGIIKMSYWKETRRGPFADNQNLDTVVVPQGVTTIGVGCFENSSIRRIYLPSSLEAIAYDAFKGSQLEEVYWYDANENSDTKIVYNADQNTYNWEEFYKEVSEISTVKRVSIGSHAFANCEKLTLCDLSRATALYKGVFENCPLIDTVNLTNLRFAQEKLFAGCIALKTVIMNADTVLGGYTFEGSGIESIEFYGNDIPDALFYGAKSLESVIVHGDLKSVGAKAFENCSALEEIEFRGTCEKIGASAFKGCTLLETVTLPEGVEEIGDFAFASCPAMETLYVHAKSNIQYVGLNVFKGSNALKQIKVVGENDTPNYAEVTNDGGIHVLLTNANGTRIVLVPPTFALNTVDGVFTVPTNLGGAQDVTEIGWQAYAGNSALNGKELVIPEGITSIGNAAFQNTGITKVVIPSTVTEIGAYAFADCKQLETVVFLCDLEVIPAHVFANCAKLNYVQLPGSVKEIKNNAFEATGIKSMAIGENVERIGDEAFLNCEMLSELKFAENGYLETIGYKGFAGCAALETLEMPDTLKYLGDYAFADCATLTKAYVSAGLVNMGDYAFTNDLMLTEVVIGDGAKEIGDFAFYTPYEETGFYYQQYLRSVTVPDSVQYVGDYAFAGNTVLESITLKGVKTLGVGAFLYTPALKTVTITDAMERIGVQAFANSGIETIDLSVVEYFDAQCFFNTNVQAGNFTNAIVIANAAFYDCKNITQVSLPNVVEVYASAFFIPRQDSEGNVQEGTITSVTFGDKLKTLGGGAFFNAKFKSIALPATLEDIGAPAFAGCFDLATITVGQGNKTYFVENGGLYKNLANGTYELVAVPNATRMDKVADTTAELEPFVIKDGTSRVGSWAMGYCEYIHAVEIPASVKTLGMYAFYYMGMGVLNEAIEDGEDTQSTRKYYTKYIFKGLQAPTLEASYNEESSSILDIYVNFTYPLGYLMNDMVIPVNAKGFESLLYEYCFFDKEYSAEIMEEGTTRLVNWLNGLNVDLLTLADEATVSEMNMIYFMMAEGQKNFVTETNRQKLTAAVAKIEALKNASAQA